MSRERLRSSAEQIHRQLPQGNPSRSAATPGGLTITGVQVQTSTAPTTIVPGSLGTHFIESATNISGPAFASFFGSFNQFNTTGIYALHASIQVASAGYTPGQGFQTSLTQSGVGTLFEEFITFPTSPPINHFNINCNINLPPSNFAAGDQFLIDIFTSDTVNVDFQIHALYLIGYA